MPSVKPSIRVFVGDTITNSAEIACIRRLSRDLKAENIDAVILANFMLGIKRRQIDIVVATNETAIVVEVKSYIHPIDGDVNGRWSLTLDDGSRKDLGNTNPYIQALENRFVVADGLRAQDGADFKEAIGGMLCIYPIVAKGSIVPAGNFKLGVGDYGELRAMLQAPRKSPIPLDRWIQFAYSINLSEQDAATPSAAETHVNHYVVCYRDLSSAIAQPYVEPTFEGDETIESLASDIASGEQIQIVGASGSGKSELVSRLAVACSCQGVLPIMIRGRDFEREIGPQLRAATARYTSLTVPALFAAAASAGTQVVLYVDALNECPRKRRNDFIAALQAARINFGVRIVTSSQDEQNFPSTIKGRSVTLRQPDSAQARRIVEAHLGRKMDEGELANLEVVATAQDAAVLATILSEGNAIDSRFSLYHTFTRARLDTSASSSIHRRLSTFAMELRLNFVSALARSAAERIANHQEDGTVALAHDAGLLWSEQGKIGFRHDLFGDFYAAEALLRQAVTTDELRALAGKPIYAELREFILGGCATSAEIEALLAKPLDSRLLESALSGRSGNKARLYVVERMLDLIRSLEQIYRNVSLELPSGVTNSRELSSLMPTFPKLDDVSPINELYLALIPSALGNELLPHLVRLFANVDERLIAEADRLKIEHPQLQLAWRAAAFGTVYGMHLHTGPRHLQNLLQSIQNSWPNRRGTQVSIGISRHFCPSEKLSVGQLFLMLSLLRGSLGDPLPRRFPNLLQQVWDTRVYHLRLIICDIIRFRGSELPDQERAEVRNFLNQCLSDNNVWLNSIVIDALEGVDGIEHDFTIESAAKEYETLLALPETPESRSLAVSALTQTYDHPYRDQYWEAFYKVLPVEKRQALLMRGLRDEPGDPWFISDILRALRREPTPTAEPELQRIASGPRLGGHSQQYAVIAFVEAVALLARMQLPLRQSDPAPNDASMRAWYHVAPLIYALNGGKRRVTVDSFLACGASEAFDVIQRISREVRRVGLPEDTNVTFAEQWPEMLRTLAQAVLAEKYEAASAFAEFQLRPLADEHTNAALQFMGDVGTSTDLQLIRNWVDHPVHGETALRTARVLESGRY